jgi:hypothetical protein
VPRREMFDAPFSDIEADFKRALERCREGAHKTSGRHPRRRAPSAAQGL